MDTEGTFAAGSGVQPRPRHFWQTPFWSWLIFHPYTPPNGERYLSQALLAPWLNLLFWVCLAGALVFFIRKKL